MPRQKLHKDRVYQVIGEPNPGARVAGYARYSSELQDIVSLATQERRMQRFFAQKGWTFTRWYEEPERSAKYEQIEERPVFAALLADAGLEFDVVVCYTNDRWARNAAVAFNSLSLLRGKRVWWATADGLWDIDRVQQDGFDVAFAIDTQMNAAYVRRLSKRVIDGKEDRARDGYHNGSVPFGYLPPEYPKAPDGAPSTWKPPRAPVRADPATFPALVRIGELAAMDWSDSAIADELAGYVSTTPRFGPRPLSKDTVAAIRRMWFPREFRPGCGQGTIETPSGDLIEGHHAAAWPYELWQRMVEAKTRQYRRPRGPAQKHVHEFSALIVCADCRRPLRVQPYLSGHVYYRDTSAKRKLVCPTGGFRMVSSIRVLEQFGNLLTGIHLPSSWRALLVERCQASSHRDRDGDGDGDGELNDARRSELGAEQKRLVMAFSKGYISETDLDGEIDRIRAELALLPPAPPVRDLEAFVARAIEAGEALIDMVGYWREAQPEERRDIAWAIMPAEGLIYDLERRAIAGVLPRPDLLPALALGLGPDWAHRTGRLWRRDLEAQPKIAPVKVPPPSTPPALTPEQRTTALALVRSGQSLRTVAARFPGVSHSAIWRLMQAQAQGDGIDVGQEEAEATADGMDDG